ncbi:MAG: cation:proton antiporter, partial [Paramuribaculum sp.]|nr:cation:proton antiporter [Paramuribaculum sp.]
LGAFVMGSILAGTSFAERIEHVVAPVKDLFGAVFFISVGLMVNPSVIVTYFGSIVLLSLLVIVGMIIFGTLGMLVTGQNLRISIESGFALTQIGEFSFIIATLGMGLGVLNPELYPVIVAVSVITTFGTPYLIRLSDPVYKFVEKHLPKRLTYLIERNSYDAAKEKSSTKQIWHNIVSRYLWRVLLYSIMLIAIILVSQGWLLPTLLEWNESWGRLLTAVITVGAMSPFVLAMTVPSSRKSERRKLKEADSRFDLPLVIMTTVKLTISLSSLVYILTVIYSFSIGLSFGVAILLTAIFFLSSDLRFKMRRMESKFIDNLNERELRKSGKNNNIVSNLHLAFMTVSCNCPFVGEKLQNSQLRVKYGANIASIQRGGNVIPVPGGDTRLFPGDILGVIGTDEEIQAILPLIEAPESESGQTQADIDPADLKLFPVTLTSKSPLIGKTVAQANMREKYTALIVSLERNGIYSQPSAGTEFQDGDIVWVVAPNSSMEALNKQ